MKSIKHGLIWMTAVAVFPLAGCVEPPLLRSTYTVDEMPLLRCTYTVGELQTIRFHRDFQYRSWLEMPDKEPAESGMRKIVQELIVRRKVESVQPDGSAVMKVTFEKASIAIDTKKSPNLYHYVSDRQNTKTSNPQEPKLAGASYRIRIAPNSTILEIIGLDELRKKLNMDKTATGVVSNWLTEKSIRLLHERDFVKYCPDNATYNQTYESLVSIPDAMVKARAIRRTYTIGPNAVKNDMSKWVTVTSKGEAAYNVPDDFPPAPKAIHMGQSVILDASEMNELKVEGTGTFDLTAAVIRNDTYHVKCTLIISGDTLFGRVPLPGQEGKGGEMFTTIELTETYELLP